MDLFEEDFAFEFPLYTPSQLSLESNYKHGLVRNPRQRKRYTPYLVPHRSMHKMNLYYVDAAYIEDAREVYRPAAPEPALDAILHPPPNGIGAIAIVGLRAVNRILGFVNNQVQNLHRTVLARD
jgi:hypothetical protein